MNGVGNTHPLVAAVAAAVKPERGRLLILATVGTIALLMLTSEPTAVGAAGQDLELRLWPPVLIALAPVVAGWGIRGIREIAARIAGTRPVESPTLERANPAVPAHHQASTSTAPASMPASVLVSRVGRVSRLIRVDEIDWIEAAGRYAAAHVAGRRHLIDQSLSALDASLGDRFVRVHRSTLVPTDRVESVRRSEGRDFEIELRDGTTLRLSRTYREDLERALGISI